MISALSLAQERTRCLCCNSFYDPPEPQRLSLDHLLCDKCNILKNKLVMHIKDAGRRNFCNRKKKSQEKLFFGNDNQIYG